MKIVADIEIKNPNCEGIGDKSFTFCLEEKNSILNAKRLVYMDNTQFLEQ